MRRYCKARSQWRAPSPICHHPPVLRGTYLLTHSLTHALTPSPPSSCLPPSLHPSLPRHIDSLPTLCLCLLILSLYLLSPPPTPHCSRTCSFSSHCGAVDPGGPDTTPPLQTERASKTAKARGGCRGGCWAHNVLSLGTQSLCWGAGFVSCCLSLGRRWLRDSLGVDRDRKTGRGRERRSKGS